MVGAGHHAHQAALVHHRERRQLAHGKNSFHVRGAARGAEVADLLVEGLPVTVEGVGARRDQNKKRSTLRIKKRREKRRGKKDRKQIAPRAC